jgi:sodium-dependent dicarboxylate transporter 2/3/5
LWLWVFPILKTAVIRSMKGEQMLLRSKWVQLAIAVALGIIVFLLPRPEGTRFTIKGDHKQAILQHITDHFTLVPDANDASSG